MTKDEVNAGIHACAKKLGKNPSKRDLRKHGLSSWQMIKYFGSIGKALQQAGMRPEGTGFAIGSRTLLLDWAAVARKLEHLPAWKDYARLGRYSKTPFKNRWGAWLTMPDAFRLFADEAGLEEEWADVLRMVDGRSERETASAAAYLSSWKDIAPLQGRPVNRLARRRERSPRRNMEQGGSWEESVDDRKRPFHRDRPIYGPLIIFPGLANEPVDELGVVFVFGMLAHRLGFAVLRTQAKFPDCEALREIQPEKWQRVRIEFEYESRNFSKHGHKKDACDLIVCWRHNWTECPSNLEVIELSSVLRKIYPDDASGRGSRMLSIVRTSARRVRS
jgi:hypothetical protein